MPGLGMDANWDPRNNAATFSSNQMNQILTEEYMDSFDFWQQRYNLFSVMTLNQDRNYKITYMRSNPLLVQPHKSCGWDPIGGLTFDHKEYRPCKAKINTEQCYDELFNSCFKHFLDWREAGPVQLNQEGRRMYNNMMNVIMRSAVQSVKLTNTLGKFFDKDKVKNEFADNVSTDIPGLFNKTIANPEICAGYLYLIRELGKINNNANVDFSKVVDFTKKGIEGDVEDVLELIECNTSFDLKHIQQSGGEIYLDSNGNQKVVVPVFLATKDWMSWIKNEYKKQNNDVNMILNRERCITMEKVMYGSIMKKVYYLDETPVVPIEDTMYADKYLKGNISALILTTTGNIAMGGSFGSIKSLRNPNMGLRVQMHEDNDKYGKYSVLGHMLIKNTILNTDLVTGYVKYLGETV